MTGADIAKSAAIDMFDWIVTHNLFGKVKLVCMVHDEICFEYPEYLQQFPSYPQIVKPDLSKMKRV